MNSKQVLRIAIISVEYLVNASGSEKGAQALAEALVNKGHKVYVFTSHYKNHPKELNGVKIYPVLNKLFQNKKRFIHEYVNSFSTIIKIAILSRQNKVQILNVHDDQMLGVFTGIVGKILGIPVILTWIKADLGFESFKQNGKYWTYLIRRFKARMAVNVADRVMLKGILPDALMKRYSLKREKIFHAPNPTKIPLAPSHYENNDIRDKWGLKDFFIVANVATRMGDNKGIDTILKTAKVLKDRNNDKIKFLFIGGKRPSALEFWRRKAKQYEVEDRVIFTGYQPDIFSFLYQNFYQSG